MKQKQTVEGGSIMHFVQVKRSHENTERFSARTVDLCFPFAIQNMFGTASDPGQPAISQFCGTFPSMCNNGSGFSFALGFRLGYGLVMCHRAVCTFCSITLVQTFRLTDASRPSLLIAAGPRILPSL